MCFMSWGWVREGGFSPCYYFYMTHAGYFIDVHGGQPWYRCFSCQYDCFSRDGIREHVRFSCQPKALPETEVPLEEWRQRCSGAFPSLKIAVSLLTWNTAEASEYAAMALVREKKLLADLGITLDIFWADNGSTDDTKPLLKDIFWSNLAAKFHFKGNLGQSKARNVIRTEILRGGFYDYWLMVDGDIEVIPYSSFAMARYLESVSPSVGCLGMHSRNCTHERDPEVAQECRKIDQWMVSRTPVIAWTNYGMFRRSAVEQVQFDETGPFAGPGWGYEDDDFELSMAEAGFHCVNTMYFRYMHRRLHSSLRNLDAKSSALKFRDRQKYVVSKWKDKSDYHKFRVSVLDNQSMPVLDY